MLNVNLSEFLWFILRYGSVLMGKELTSFKAVMKSFMVLIVTALAMGETLAMAPDLLKGNQMVASVFEVLDRKTEIMGDVGEELRTVEGTIELRGVKFSYPSRPDVIIFKDFDLKVRSGRSMALVGQSGSGKSSVLALILRFYDPSAGKVLIDGKFTKHASSFFCLLPFRTKKVSNASQFRILGRLFLATKKTNLSRC